MNSPHPIKLPMRPVSFPFHDFKSQIDKKPMEFTKKVDGFHMIAMADPYGKVVNATKSGIILPGGTTCRVLKAIDSYLVGLPDEDRVDPARVERYDEGGLVAFQVHFEFGCVRKDAGESAPESLQDLFHGKCLNADGSLNVVDYEYPIKIFDALFKARVPYFARLEAVFRYYGESMTVERIFSFEELVKVLNTSEGVVGYRVYGNASGFEKGEFSKIKVPCPVSGFIVGVQNTLGCDFVGWNKFLFCVQGRECALAICEIDMTQPLTDPSRPSKGKVYANPKCVKYSPEKGTVVYELKNGVKSTSALAPLLNALYGLIGKSMKFPAVNGSSTEAKIRVVEGFPSTVHCGRNRSFSLSGYEFLTNPIPAIMGTNDIWALKNKLHPGAAELHLQAASVLCLPGAGYGPAEFMDLPPTNEDTLRIAAEQRLCRDRVKYYEFVGMETGPFHGLSEMPNALFCAE